MDFINKYFFVNSCDIDKCLLINKKDASGVTYYPNGTIKVNNIFNINGIPSEFQKIVMVSNISMKLKKYDTIEFVSGFKFNFIKHHKNPLKGYVDAINCPFCDAQSNQWFYNYLSFNTIIKYVDFSSVVSFYSDLNFRGLLDAYFDTLRQIFEFNSDILKNIDVTERDFKKVLRK